MNKPMFAAGVFWLLFSELNQDTEAGQSGFSNCSNVFEPSGYAHSSSAATNHWTQCWQSMFIGFHVVQQGVAGVADFSIAVHVCSGCLLNP